MVFSVVFTLVTVAVSMQQRAHHPHLHKQHHESFDDTAVKLLKAGLKMTRPRSLAAVEMKADAEAEFACQTANWTVPGTLDQISPIEGETLCSDGKAVPQVYLLGTMKGATSSIAADFSTLGFTPADGENKEFHFFAHKFDTSETNLAASRRKWLDILPDCPQTTGQAKLLADYTPHMHYVPLPQDTRPLYPGPPANFSLPYALSTFYSEAEKTRLVMTMSLREPLSRMQSAWYAAQKCESRCICTWCRHQSYAESLKHQLTEFNKTKDRGVSDWLWASLYGHQLELWLKYFPADRFVVVPMGIYSHQGIEPVCRAVGEKANFTLKCERPQLKPDNEGESSTHRWHTKHKSVEQDAPALLRAAWKEMLFADKQKLVSLLVQAHGKGATLVGYEGAEANAASIESWLDENW